jgi:hypothetical protein
MATPAMVRVNNMDAVEEAETNTEIGFPVVL